MVSIDGNIEHFYSIIPAGGVGSRLWPLSRADEPKFLLDLFGTGLTLLQDTWARLVPLSTRERTLVVSGYNHADAVRKQLPDLTGANLVLEPTPRDSTAAICMAAAIIARRDPEAIIGSFPADHVVKAPAEFRRVIQTAVKAASAGYVTVVGITPTEPSTAYGYIEADGDMAGKLKGKAWHASGFVEKPDEATATEYVASGRYLWNAGMFIAKASVLLEILRAERPALAAGIEAIAEHWGTAEGYALRDVHWGNLEKVAIDYAIAEPAAAQGKVAVVPGEFGWDDVGDFSSIAAQLTNGVPGKLAIVGDTATVLSEGSSGVVIGQTNRVIALIAMDDVVVVDTTDALLITTTGHAQKVKKMVDLVKREGIGGVL